MTNSHIPCYRWDHPTEWIRDAKLTNSDLIHFIIKNCDGDQIQDYFQNDMIEDGYFEDLCPPKEEEESEDESA